MNTPAEIRKGKLENYFSLPDAEKDFAQLMRQFIFESSMLALKADDNKITPNKEIISEACIFLNELCETLDPHEAAELLQ